MSPRNNATGARLVPLLKGAPQLSLLEHKLITGPTRSAQKYLIVLFTQFFTNQAEIQIGMFPYTLMTQLYLRVFTDIFGASNRRLCPVARPVPVSKRTEFQIFLRLRTLSVAENQNRLLWPPRGTQTCGHPEPKHSRHGFSPLICTGCVCFAQFGDLLLLSLQHHASK